MPNNFYISLAYICTSDDLPMPKQFFVPKTPITSTFLNAINNPVFVENPEQDGQIPLVRDTDLSNDSNQIKQSVYDFIDNFRVESTNGLNVTLWLAKRQLSDSTYNTPGTQTITLPNNTSGEIWLNWITGQLVVSNVVAGTSLRPKSGYPIYSYATVNGVITQLNFVYSRTTKQDMPPSRMLNLFGGRSLEDATWAVGSTNMTLDKGRYVFNNLTINMPNANTGIIFKNNVLIQCAGDLIINGTNTAGQYSFIRVEPTSLGVGSSFYNESGDAIAVNGRSGSLPLRNLSVSWSLDNQGNPGESATALIASYNAYGGSGGAGGGRLHFQVAGRIIINKNVLLSAVGGNGQSNLSFASAGDKADRLLLCGGGGAGSGGLVLIQSATSVTYTGQTIVDTSGGDGGNANLVLAGRFSTLGGASIGGSGGGGGWFVTETPEVFGIPTYVSNPGDRGFDILINYNVSTSVSTGGGVASGYGGNGGYYFLASVSTPLPSDEDTGIYDTWYRPATAGQSEQLLRFPTIF